MMMMLMMLLIVMMIDDDDADDDAAVGVVIVVVGAVFVRAHTCTQRVCTLACLLHCWPCPPCLRRVVAAAAAVNILRSLTNTIALRFALLRLLLLLLLPCCFIPRAHTYARSTCCWPSLSTTSLTGCRARRLARRWAGRRFRGAPARGHSSPRASCCERVFLCFLTQE